MNKWVTLANKQMESDEDFTALDPDGAWAEITPQFAIGDSSRSMLHVVRMRWHPDVSLDTRIVYQPTRDRTITMFVRGVQNVNMDDDMLQLSCEEILP